MEKLLKLLNEFEESKKSDKIIGQEYYFVEEKELSKGHIVWYDPTTNEHLLSWVPFECVVCSKPYWFIERLVSNQKISRVKEVINDIEYYGHWQIENVDCYSQYDSLLMLLAIQDDPISFLISILK